MINSYRILSYFSLSQRHLHTKLCDLLNIQYPIIQAGMAGGPTTPELVAAVSNAGGLGILAASRLTPEQLRDAIQRIKSFMCSSNTSAISSELILLLLLSVPSFIYNTAITSYKNLLTTTT
jgi:NAD(P)H-dependent flavin oxidoreductase YrpB (nitropropane dioxygenase family)